MAEQGIDLIVVDYLQLMHGSGLYKENRVLEIGEISQGLKNIARELKVPVLSLAQLSRAVENRGTKQPMLSDLRESGSIEQDADVVMFLYREDDDERENVKLGIAKHRNGALREIDLFFRGDRVRFFGVERKMGLAPQTKESQCTQNFLIISFEKLAIFCKEHGVLLG
jgi:replicative DNA helicase